MKRSYLGGLRVKLSPTKHGLDTTRFQFLVFFLPVLIARNISSSETGLTLGIGTAHLPAFSFRFCLIVLLSTLALVTPSRSNKYAGTAPGWISSALACLFALSE